MSTYNHTAIATGAAATAANLNSPLSELDAAIKLNKYNGTAAPGVGDDTADGYTVGSRWIDTTNDRAYVAVDVTLGAAVWQEISFPASVAQAFAINTSAPNTGLTITFTGSSSSAIAGQLTLAVNDGAAMASGDRLGQIAFNGHNGTSVVSGPLILVQTTETWSGTARGSKMMLYTIPNTTTTQTVALTLQQNQQADFAGDANVASGKVYRVNNVQVTGARSTGWGAPTGTPTRTTFATGSVTTAQLAERVKALIDDLTTHGLIGT